MKYSQCFAIIILILAFVNDGTEIGKTDKLDRAALQFVDSIGTNLDSNESFKTYSFFELD